LPKNEFSGIKIKRSVRSAVGAIAGMISFAQNFEDVILARLFQGRSAGFYVDVGAGDPVTMSVTKWFYDQGWSGINVEPNQTFFDRLTKARARDINLNCGVGAVRSRGTFWETPIAELSTFDDGVHAAAKANAGGVSTEVGIFTLSEIIDQHAAGRQIDFLKIDVEGWEYNVLQGLDLERHRPLAMVIEAVFPETRIETHSQWEQLIITRGYKYVYFDGLNRFYLAEEFEHLTGDLWLPPNVFDAFRINNPHFDQLQRDNLILADKVTRLQIELERGACSAFKRVVKRLLPITWTKHGSSFGADDATGAGVHTTIGEKAGK
jgi:FkbM family methyltransferase